MPPLSDHDLKYLEALSYLVTILSAPLIAASVMAAFGQIKSQTKTARYQVSLQALLSFAEQYKKISDYRSALRERFENRDPSLNERSIKAYFNRFWLNNSQQYVFFRKGLIPKETFISWTVFSYGLMTDHATFHYYAADGTQKTYLSRYFFEEHFLKSGYKNEKSFYNFCLGLYNLNNRVIPPEEERYDLVARYVTDYARKNRIPLED